MSNDDERYQNRFRQMVATNAAYWLRRVQAQAAADEGARIDALRAEQGNLLKAMERALAEPTAQALGVSLTMEMYTLAELQGWWVDWRAYLDKGLRVASPQSAEAATLMQQMAELYGLFGDMEAAQTYGELAVDLWQTLANPHGMAYAQSVLSLVYAQQGRISQAIAACEQAVLALASSEDQDSKVCQSLLGRIHNNWGLVCEISEDDAGALTHNDQAEVHLRQSGQIWKLPRLWHNRGNIYRRLGRLAEAEAAFKQAVVGHEANHDVGRGAMAISTLSVLAHMAGDPSRALLLAAQAEPGLQQVGNQASLARLYNNRGEYYKALQRFADAEAAFQEAIARWQALGQQPRGLANSLSNLAELYVMWERPQAARPLLLAARVQMKMLSHSLPNIARLVDTLLAQIGEA